MPIIGRDGMKKIAEDARYAERERIADAIKHEADICPCVEDAKVLRSAALLVRADFSYDEAEKLEAAAEAAAGH